MNSFAEIARMKFSIMLKLVGSSLPDFFHVGENLAYNRVPYWNIRVPAGCQLQVFELECVTAGFKFVEYQMSGPPSFSLNLAKQ